MRMLVASCSRTRRPPCERYLPPPPPPDSSAVECPSSSHARAEASRVHHRADVTRMLLVAPHEAVSHLSPSVLAREVESEGDETHRLRLERRELDLARRVDPRKGGQVADLVDLWVCA